MNEQNTPEQTIQKENAVGRVGRSAIAQALLRSAAGEKAEPQPEESGSPSPDDAAGELLNLANDGAQAPGDSGTGESEQELEVWQFGGKDYTADQVEESLREREMYQRYNATVTPLIESIEKVEAESIRFKEMALTETEKRIDELQKAIKSGRLDPRQKAAAYDQLEEEHKKQKVLAEAADQALATRNEAMKKAREQNARQSVAALLKSGWSQGQVKSVGALAGQVLGNRFADVMSPQLMQVFRDAAELRTAKEGAAKRFKAKTDSALKTVKQTQQKSAQQPKGPRTLGEMVWGSKGK